MMTIGRFSIGVGIDSFPVFMGVVLKCPDVRASGVSSIMIFYHYYYNTVSAPKRCIHTN